MIRVVWVACALAVGCGTNGVDESDLVGSYRVPPPNCDYGEIDIAADNTIKFNDRVATLVMIDGVRTAQTGTPNVTFLIDYTLGGEGGHIHEMFELWIDHDGGSGTQNGCGIPITRLAM